MRREGRVLLHVLLIAAVLKPDATRGDTWSQRQRDSQHTGRSDFAVPIERQNTSFFDSIRWQTPSPGSPVEGNFSGTSMSYFDGAGPGGEDVVVGGYHWPKGVQGMNRHTGARFWSGNPRGGESIGVNTPAFSNSGSVIYVTNDATESDEYPLGHPLMAFPSAMGPATYWHNGLDPVPTHLGSFNPTIGPDGRIFLHSWVDRPYAGTDVGSGIQESWAAATNADCGLSDVSLYDDAGQLRVIIGSRSGFVVAYDGFSGAELWRRDVSAGIDATVTIDPNNGNAYVGAGDGHVYVVGLDKNGNPLWAKGSMLVFEHLPGANTPQRAQAGGCLSQDGSTYYFQTNSAQADGRLYAIRTNDGSLKWSFPTASQGWEGRYSSPIVTPNGIVVVGNNESGTYFALRDDGTSASLLDTLATAPGGNAQASATLSADGLLYLPVRTIWTAGNSDNPIPTTQVENVFTAFDLTLRLPVPAGQFAFADDQSVTINWDPYPAFPHFKHFAIYRQTSPFESVQGLTPIALLNDSSATFFNDTTVTNGTSYYYAVTAVSTDGTEDDAIQSVGPRVPGPTGAVRVTGYYSTAHVDWDPVANPDAAGYEVFRRTASGDYPFTPLKRVLVRPSFTDYGLTPGETYFYKVAAIDGSGHQITAFANEKATTLRASNAGLSKHKNFELLMVFYTGGFTDEEVSALSAGLKKGIEFYWRTTRARLNLDVTWLYINKINPGVSTDWNNQELQIDLRARGVQDDQYDLAYLVGADLAGCLGGYVVFGSTCASLGTVCGVPYPEKDPMVDYTIAWTFTHEIHHALETMENISGPSSPEVLFCHFPWAYPDPLGPTGLHMDWGPHFDGIAQTNRVYGDQWMHFPQPYDGYIECVDADEDGFPDDDDRVPANEVGFGSNASLPDTDLDGLSDLAEYTVYNFRGTDPLRPDTDGDGIHDGKDSQPLYQAPRFIPLADPPPLIDGELSSLDHWQTPIQGYYFTQEKTDFPLFSFMAYEPDALYFAFQSDRPLRFKISIDGSGEDGRFESPVRYVTGATDTFNTDNKGNQIGDSWSDPNHIYTSFGADSVGVFDRSLISGASVASMMTPAAWYVTEVKIPRGLPAGAAYTWYPPDAPVVDGLTLGPGHIIGVNITCSDLENSDDSEYSGLWTSVFETHSLVDFTLQLLGDADIDGDFDLRDFQSLQSCFGPLQTGCRAVDMDGNGVVSLADYDDFFLAMKGPE